MTKDATTNDATMNVEMLVLGGGPGGYTAAFRAADLGLNTAIVERYGVLGGVCLNVGCVPSKALLHATSLVAGVTKFVDEGIFSSVPSCDIDGLRAWTGKIVSGLNAGLAGLAKRRKIKVLNGEGTFISENVLEVRSKDKTQRIQFDRAVIATGSSSATLPFLPDDDRIWDSTDALKMPFIPDRLLVIGGGVIGLEMATVYQRLGSHVSIVETAGSLLPSVDSGTVRPLFLSMKKKCDIYTASQVKAVSVSENVLTISLDGKKSPDHIEADAVLVSIGRHPNVAGIGLEKIKVHLNDRSQIRVDECQRTNVPHIFAIGDVTPGPMLAHRASAEGKIAAEVAAGMDSQRTFSAVPQVAYTSPEVATSGISEKDAVAAGVPVGIGKFPFAANARAMTLGEPIGFVKLIFNTETDVVIGAEMVGPHVDELIAEVSLGIQNGLTVGEMTRTVHPHPSLSESIMMSAEVFEGTVTDLYIPKNR